LILLWAALNIHAEPLPANVLYFILVDRFSNANLSNDSVIDITDPQSFHGGDLQGIISHLDYLEDLGVDAIWLSPIFSMREEKFHSHGAFHGYWTDNLETIEPRFGGEDAFTALSKEAEQREIYLILDMVYNHVSFDSSLLQHHPDWFYNYPSITDWNDPFQLTHYSVHGLPDINHENEKAYSYLLENSIKWQQKGSLSGFRLDAIRHMENNFISQISNDLHQQIGSSFWLLGEDFQGNPNALIERAEQSNLDALFDFPMHYAIADSFCHNKGMSPVSSILTMDQYYPNDLQLVRFLDNHDVPRIITRCNDNPQKAFSALFFIFSIRGLPMITYGTEGWLSGEHEPENRKDMPWNQLVLTDSLKRLIQLRKQYPVLSTGNGRIIEYDENWLVYQQQDDHHLSFYIHNATKRPKKFTPPDWITKDPLVQIGASNGLTQLTSMKIAPNSSALFIYQDIAPDHEQVTLRIRVKSKSKQNLYLVGSSPEVGGWDPNIGVPLQKKGKHWVGDVTMAKGSVISCKIVTKDGENFIWEEGNNHILWIDKNKSTSIKSRL
jgi:glycosidase